MTLTLDATPGAASANTYALVADLDAYMETMVFQGSVYPTATPEQKGAALVQATRMLDTLDWLSIISNHPQPLQWPRYWVPDRNGYFLDSQSIPTWLRDACCEFAFRLLSEDRSADAGGLAPDTVKVGSLDVGKLRRRPIPASVMEMVSPYLKNASGPRMVLG